MARAEGSRTRGRRQLGPDHQLPPGRGPGRFTANGPGEPGLSDLIRSLANDLGTLIRQEIDLARMELTHTARRLAADGAWIGIGAAIAAVGALCLVVAMALGLGVLLGSYFLGTLITGFLLVLMGGAFAMKGIRDLKKQELVPRRTAESLREDARWAKEEAEELKQRIVED